MCDARKLTFFFGPYECGGVIRHRKQRIVGLANELKGDYPSICIDFEPISLYDRLIVECNGYVLYQCKITNMNCRKFPGGDRASHVGFQVIDQFLKQTNRPQMNNKLKEKTDPIFNFIQPVDPNKIHWL